MCTTYAITLKNGFAKLSVCLPFIVQWEVGVRAH